MSKQFAEFRVGELFDVSGSRSTDAGTLHLKDEGSFQFVGRTSTNNGIQGFCGNLGFPANDGREISISQVGTIDAQWREMPYYTSQNVVRCRAKGAPLSVRTGLYITTILKKHLLGFVGYTTPKVTDIVNFELTLPITDASANTDTPEPDWDYMEDYIKTIERRYVDQVAVLNTREQQVLTQLHPGGVDVEPVAQGYADFRVGDVFETVGKTYTGPGFWIAPEPRHDNPLLPPMPAGSAFIPLITGSTMDNGISGWAVSTEHINVSPCISIAPHSGYVALQRSFVAIGQNAYAIHLLHGDVSLRSLMYCVCVLQKLLHVGIDYSNLASWGIVKDKIIQLPVTAAGEIDWGYMERYIAWIEERESRALRAAREEQILMWLHQYH